MANATDIMLIGRPSVSANSLLSLRSLQEAALKLADVKNAPHGLSTRSLLGLLMCQAQRNRRLAMDPVRIHLRLSSRHGSFGVKLRLGATNSDH
ncbi:hypothetical protein [uncultured Bartonella sp.]|uniref:hypothetical protein n=1 Tax=uncultured Bartonella sp. TaxID=104108 RepID=UPI002624F782|nr:hypothetical protein [uncultured Bartonella sp.]